MGSDCNETTCRVGLKLRLLYDCIKRELATVLFWPPNTFQKDLKITSRSSSDICSDCFAAGKFKIAFRVIYALVRSHNASVLVQFH